MMINNGLSIKRIKSVFFLLFMIILTSCLENGEETIVLESGTGIPHDSKAGPNPDIGYPTTNIPNFQYTVEQEGKNVIIRVDMTGIQDPQTLEWLRLAGTGGSKGNKQNVWVSVDGRPKGIAVYNNADNESNKVIMADLVFLVDNSGSMSEEADAIARDIVAWASRLARSNLDVKFGCVGYDDYGKISGALNITGLKTLSNYFGRTDGTSRTVGFEGPDAAILENAASSYPVPYCECGVIALRFADASFSFRRSANRIYVNFTDESNQPDGNKEYSVEYVNSQQRWEPSKGTIHTVYSGDTTFMERELYFEKPWKMSRYTGGTELYASSDFEGISLDRLPVTGAMQNSYIIRFTNVEEFMDGASHSVKVTILSEDERVRAEKIFSVVFGEKS